MSDTETAKNLFFEALAALDASDFHEAELKFRAALAFSPHNQALLTNLSIALVQQDKRVEGRRYAEQALALKPDNVEALLVVADCHARDGNLDAALDAYDRIVILEPAIADTHNNRGLVLARLGRQTDALEAYERALVLNPHFSEAHLNRGNALHYLESHRDALASYERAGDLAEAWLGRGNSLVKLRRYEDGLAAYRQSLALKPNLAAGWLGCGNVFNDRKLHSDALIAYDKALLLAPDLRGAWIGRGEALRLLQRPTEAIAAYQRALQLGGDADTLKYYLAALGAAPAPAAMPKRFVADLFDFYADNFEHHLVGNLNYQAPGLLAEAIKQHAKSQALDILDLGCGTGLLGERLGSLKRTLTGVDLSPNMLEKARQRSIYDHLVCGDLIAFLQTQARDETFDLVAATDVFIYVGELSPIFREVRRTLRENGLFGFSVESAQDGDFVLRSTLRYAQSENYLRRLAQDYGFAIEAMDSHPIRRENNQNIAGTFAVMRCR